VSAGSKCRFPPWEANSVPQILQLDLRGHFEAGKEGKGRKGRGKGKGRKVWVKTPPPFPPPKYIDLGHVLDDKPANL